MDFEGNTLANTGEIDALTARVVTLEDDVKDINTQLVNLTQSVDSLQTSGTMASPATHVILTSLTGAAITPTLKGSPTIPDVRYKDNISMRIRVYGQLTAPVTNRLAIWISLTNDGNNNVTTASFFGIPVYLTATSCIFEFNITFNHLTTGGCTGSGSTIAYFNPMFVDVSPDFSVNPSAVSGGLNFYLWGRFEISGGASFEIEMMTIEQISGFD